MTTSFAKFFTSFSLAAFILTVFILTAGIVSAPSVALAERSESDSGESADEDRSLIVGALLYLPNRVFDILDIFRLRVRVGPGLAANARVTSVAAAFVGTYATVYAGLPGPRHFPTIPLPVGLESHNGATVSVLDATVDGGIGPDYGVSEIGAGFQLAIIGVDFGFDPLELADFALGILTLDPQADDL